MPDDELIRIEVTDVLDLHSVPPREVGAVVEAYLDEAWRLGFSAVRIIHGKGIGVQRETVRKALQRNGFVKQFGNAPAEAGGWGATLVNFVTRR